jgi:hypothetical protein
VLIETDRLTAYLLFWERRAGTVHLMTMFGRAKPSDRFAKLREVIEEASTQGRRVLFSPPLGSRYTDGRLAPFGLTRQQVLEFFDQYEREGPLFEYATDDLGARPVYRLLPRESGAAPRGS